VSSAKKEKNIKGTFQPPMYTNEKKGKVVDAGRSRQSGALNQQQTNKKKETTRQTHLHQTEILDRIKAGKKLKNCVVCVISHGA
jgi:hypothetical protein